MSTSSSLSLAALALAAIVALASDVGSELGLKRLGLGLRQFNNSMSNLVACGSAHDDRARVRVRVRC